MVILPVHFYNMIIDNFSAMIEPLTKGLYYFKGTTVIVTHSCNIQHIGDCFTLLERKKHLEAGTEEIVTYYRIYSLTDKTLIPSYDSPTSINLSHICPRDLFNVKYNLTDIASIDKFEDDDDYNFYTTATINNTVYDNTMYDGTESDDDGIDDDNSDSDLEGATRFIVSDDVSNIDVCDSSKKGTDDVCRDYTVGDRCAIEKDMNSTLLPRRQSVPCKRNITEIPHNDIQKFIKCKTTFVTSDFNMYKLDKNGFKSVNCSCFN